MTALYTPEHAKARIDAHNFVPIDHLWQVISNAIKEAIGALVTDEPLTRIDTCIVLDKGIYGGMGGNVAHR